VRLRGRRRTPGRPVTYATTETFLLHFGLEAINDLPGLEELKGAGLFDGRLPKEFQIPLPSDDLALTADEDPLEDEAAPELLLDLDQADPEVEDDFDDKPLEDEGSIED
jgi:segregation and condensation protein B